MKFIEAEKAATTRNGDVLELCSEFLKSGIEVAEITEWNGRYSNVSNLYVGIKTIVAGYFKDTIKVTKCGQKVFLERLKK